MSSLFEVLRILVWPLAACLVIGLLHSYAGLHVLRRGVIFVDLALAQMAALGAVVGMIFAVHHGPSHDHALSPPRGQQAVSSDPTGGDATPRDELDAVIQDLSRSAPEPAAKDEDEEQQGGGGFLQFWPTLFALGGAALLAFGRVSRNRVPHEAIIGIVYVVAAATTVLILSKAPHGHEQMEQMLTGRLLFIDRQGVLWTAELYVVLAALHWLFRRPFMAISTAPAAGEIGSLRSKLWDCVFYAMFALMVTRSVAIGGVLVVFSFLIIPGACAALFVEDWKRQVLMAWGIASAVSVVGLGLSALCDFPSGSTLVATFGATLVLSVLIGAIARRSGRWKAIDQPPTIGATVAAQEPQIP